jgi:hypothetical protein
VDSAPPPRFRSPCRADRTPENGAAGAGGPVRRGPSRITPMPFDQTALPGQERTGRHDPMTRQPGWQPCTARKLGPGADLQVQAGVSLGIP